MATTSARAALTSLMQPLIRRPRLMQICGYAGRAAAGAAAATGGLALGLHQVKRALGTQTPVDLWGDAAAIDVRCTRVEAEDAASAAGKYVALVVPDLISREEFQRAARALYPVELELMELGEQGASETNVKELVARWKEKGYIRDVGSEARERGFGRRLTSDAQGSDVGTLVPPCLLHEDGVSTTSATPWFPGQREAAVAGLQRWGGVVIRNALPEDDIAKLRVALGIRGDRGARKASELGQWFQQSDPNIAMGRYTYGRLHCLLRGSPVFEGPSVAMHTAFAPLVHAFFQHDGCNVTDARQDSIFLSEAQLIVADPCAEVQTWHMDSAGGGLTVLVPLTNISYDRGPQQILPGTHCLHDMSLWFPVRLRNCLSALSASHGAMSAPPAPALDNESSVCAWRAGDALVLDGRVLHRGLANESLGAPVPMLILRYDRKASPPPGCHRYRLRLMTLVGHSLDAIFRLYAAV